MTDTGFVAGYGLQVIQTRTALKKAVLDEISRTLDTSSSLHSPDEAWDAITAAAKDMIAAQDEWAAYIERKRAEKVWPRGTHDPATCRDGDHYGQCSGVTR